MQSLRTEQRLKYFLFPTRCFFFWHLSFAWSNPSFRHSTENVREMRTVTFTPPSGQYCKVRIFTIHQSTTPAASEANWVDEFDYGKMRQQDV